MDPKLLSDAVVEILDAKKAQDIQAMDVAEKTTLAEVFVLASGSNVTHVKALSDEVEYQIKEKFARLPERVEGRDSGRWILLDYSAVVVHIFLETERAFYNLDRLWSLHRGPGSEQKQEQA